MSYADVRFSERRIEVRPPARAYNTIVLVSIFILWTTRFSPFAWSAQPVVAAALWADAAWIGQCCLVLAVATWWCFGTTCVSVSQSALTVMHTIGPIHFGRTRTFVANRVGNMHARVVKTARRGLKSTSVSISFEYAGQKHDLLRQLQDEDAQSLLRGPLKQFTMAAVTGERPLAPTTA